MIRWITREMLADLRMLFQRHHSLRLCLCVWDVCNNNIIIFHENTSHSAGDSCTLTQAVNLDAALHPDEL